MGLPQGLLFWAENTSQDFGIMQFQEIVHVHRLWGPKGSYLLILNFEFCP